MNNPGILVVKRALRGIIKNPGVYLSGLGMSLFFVVVYNAGIGGIEFLPQFENGGYLAFILPVGIISLGFGSSGGAGQALYRDMQSGYFYRLYLSPVPRASFVFAPIFADAVAIMAETAIILAAGYMFGVPFSHGMLSVIALVSLSLLWGVMLSGFSVGLIIRSGNPQSSQMIVMIAFTLMFLSTTFLPYDMITAGWFKTVLWINPITYLLEGMRFLLSGSSKLMFFVIGATFSFAGALAAILFAVTSAKKSLV